MEQLLTWEPTCDEMVAEAARRQRDLYAQALQAQANAIEAAEKVAQVAAEDRERRAQRVAEGQADDGPSKKALADAEKEAEAAAERRDVAVRAAQLGRENMLAIADEREQVWAAAAAERVEATRQALADATTQVDASLNEWLDAKAEYETARNTRMRKRPAGAKRPPPRLRGISGENREEYLATSVIEAFARLAREDKATVGREPISRPAPPR
jgi:hypothetical protein